MDQASMYIIPVVRTVLGINLTGMVQQIYFYY
jgi:hypothetical protein